MAVTAASDTTWCRTLYIALFSRFTTCGSWEGHYILDFVVDNTSDIQPDTIHADTQGQSAAIFGLAHLLGIQLRPRIRNWKNLVWSKYPDRWECRFYDEISG
jgi:TnpA family transposase